MDIKGHFGEVLEGSEKHYLQLEERQSLLKGVKELD